MRGAVVVEAFFIVGSNCKVTYKINVDEKFLGKFKVT
jgi:hypothetical protein